MHIASSPSSVVSEARDLCRREGLFDPAGTAVLMVSGGQDSLALLHLLATQALGEHGPGDVAVLHINHHLRGVESDRDEALVRSRCADLGVACTVEHAPVPGNESAQERARELRRKHGEEYAAAIGAARIAVGHTMDDQVETMLYRIGRYGGLRSLAGMRPRSGLWVRPLLGVRRTATESYCRAHGIEFADDRGNLDPEYARTRVRGRVVPAFEDALPGAAQVAARTAEVAAEAFAALRLLAARAARDVAPAGSAWWFVPAADADAASRGAPPAGAAEPAPEWSARCMARLSPEVRRTLLHAVLGNAGVAPSRILVLGLENLGAGSGSGELALGGGVWAEKVYDRIRIVGRGFGGRTSVPPDLPAAEVPLGIPGEAVWAGLRVSAERVESLRAPDPGREAFLDARSVSEPLTVRGAVPGDRVRPLGAPGSRSLQDVLVDARVPAPLRSRLPLVVCRGRIVWIGGLAIAEEGRIRPDTRDIVRMTVRPAGSAEGTRTGV